jgi:hypothetical protein
VSDRLIRFAEDEYDYLQAREGRDFFLALAPYANALYKRGPIAEVITALEVETREALDRFAAEQNQLIEEAKAIRQELAERAPEVDNSGLEKPDDPAARDWVMYENDSFAKFDSVAAADIGIAYPVIHKDDIDPGPMSLLLQILRGRLRAAEYNEGAGINAEPIRDDLGDIAREIGNLGEKHRVSLQRYQQDSRTLAGLAYHRIAHFGSSLVDEPVVIETDEDIEAFLDRSIREWLTPRSLARKLVNGERLDDVERRINVDTEQALKAEAARLNREVVRRLGLRRRSVFDFIREEPLVVTVVGGVIAAVISGLVLALILGT